MPVRIPALEPDGCSARADSAAESVTLAVLARETGTTTELAVSGEWDLAARQTAHAAIIDTVGRGPDFVVLDLSAVTFMDSNGIHGVCELSDRCARQNIQLVIVPGPRAVQRLFEICRVADMLPFVAIGR